MTSDTPNRTDYTPGNSFSISLSGARADEGELRGYWDKLSAGGAVTMPPGAAPCGDVFGMCADKLGINWLVSIAGAATPEPAAGG